LKIYLNTLPTEGTKGALLPLQAFIGDFKDGISKSKVKRLACPTTFSFAVFVACISKKIEFACDILAQKTSSFL
jgi:hypothetical protein